MGRIDDLVVFVPFTVEGDHCEITITAVKKNYLKGHLEKILKPSLLRRAPLCPYYQVCGGCQYQHIDYDHQMTIKQKQVWETFERIGKIEAPDFKMVIPSPREYHYRGKADFQIQRSKRGNPSVGFIDTANRMVVDIERCEIVDESINVKLSNLRWNLAVSNARLTEDRYALWSDPEGGITVTDPNNMHPPKYIERFAKGKRFQVPYRGFFQTNTVLVDNLVDTVLAMCGLDGNETILDTYCGSGLFSIFLAPKAKQVFGIDNDGTAIHCAKINSRNERLDHVAFYRGDVGAVLKSTFDKIETTIDCVILDPPRTGCEKEVLNAVLALKPQKVVYISCNPATQARDSRYLIDGGFSLKSFQPLDMFPQTRHIEVVAVLEIR